MTVQQIANTIDKNNWSFTVYKTKPGFKRIAKHVFQVGDTSAYILDLIEKHKAEEIQIQPSRKNGTSNPYDVGKVITINLENPGNMNTDQFNMLTGLGNLGISPSEVFTAKDKAAEVIELKQKINSLESENKSLEKENTKLENKIVISEMKKAQKNELIDIFKSPQVMTLATAILSRGAAPALGSPSPETNNDHDEKLQWLINFLQLENTPEMAKDFMIYVAKAHQNENAATIIKELANTLMKYNIIQSQKTD